MADPLGGANIWLNRMWREPIDGLRLSLFRIALASIALCQILFSRLPNARIFYSSDGGLLAPEHAESLRSSYQRWSLLPVDASFEAIQAMLIAAAIASALLLIGCLTRLASIALFLAYSSILYANSAITNGGDWLLAAGLFLLALMPCNRYFSIDAKLWRKLGRPLDRVVEPWSMRLAQVQLCLIYTFSALHKLGPFTLYLFAHGESMGDWMSGRAVGMSLADPLVARFPWFARLPLWLSAPATWATLAFELSFPLVVLWHRTRKFALIAGIAMHVGILITMEIGHFSLTVLSFYLLFLPESWLPACYHGVRSNHLDSICEESECDQNSS